MRRFLPGILAFATLPVLTAQSSSVLDWTSYLSGDKTGYVRAVAVGPDGGIWVAGVGHRLRCPRP
jgi:ligand-binding sensor domain-containing protein